jgi:hypothetical protein
MSEESRFPKLSEEEFSRVGEAVRRSLHEGDASPRFSPSPIGIEPNMYRREPVRDSDNVAHTIYPPEFTPLAMMYLDSFATAMLACCSFLSNSGTFTLSCNVSAGTISEPADSTGLALFFTCDDDFGIETPTPTSIKDRENVRNAFIDLANAKEIATRAPGLCDSTKFVYEEIFDAYMDYPGYMKLDQSPFFKANSKGPMIHLDIPLSEDIRRRARVAVDFARMDQSPSVLFQRGDS